MAKHQHFRLYAYVILTVLWSVSVVEAQDTTSSPATVQPAQAECPVNIERQSSSDVTNALDKVLVGIDHMYDSSTSGVPYGPIKRQNTSVQLYPTGDITVIPLTDSDSNRRRLGVAFNGTHVCASIIHIREKEACCHPTDPERDCVSTCFSAFQYGEKSSLNFYNLLKLDDNTLLKKHDEVQIYSYEIVHRRCYQAEKYTYDMTPARPVSDIVTCALGQKCRITSAFVQASSDARYYVGCENVDAHLDGCDWEGCKNDVEENIPGSATKYTFHQVCRYCCKEDLCNDVRSCRYGSCDLSKKYADDDMTEDTAGSTHTFISILLMTCVVSVSLRNVLA